MQLLEVRGLAGQRRPVVDELQHDLSAGHVDLDHGVALRGRLPSPENSSAGRPAAFRSCLSRAHLGNPSMPRGVGLVSAPARRRASSARAAAAGAWLLGLDLGLERRDARGHLGVRPEGLLEPLPTSAHIHSRAWCRRRSARAPRSPRAPHAARARSAQNGGDALAAPGARGQHARTPGAARAAGAARAHARARCGCAPLAPSARRPPCSRRARRPARARRASVPWSSSPAPGWSRTAKKSTSERTATSRLADADGLDHHDVEARRLAEQQRLARAVCHTAERAARGRRPDEGALAPARGAPCASCRRGCCRPSPGWSDPPRARPRDGRASSSWRPSASMNVDLPTPGGPGEPDAARRLRCAATSPSSTA